MMPAADVVLGDTRRWLERAVIGLNLCPFAKAVHVKKQIHFVVSDASEPSQLLAELIAQADELQALDSGVRDTTLLVAPQCLADFLEFNDFVARGERAMRKRGLEGVIQLASFHPDYRFSSTEANDVTNFTNRSPYPTLHLLREASMDRAVQAFPQAEAIYEANIATLRRLGPQGWSALGVGRSA